MDQTRSADHVPAAEPVAEAADAIVSRLVGDGYDFVGGEAMRRIVEAAGGADWDGYARSWDDLGPDRFMADGGTYRKRRFACFSATAAGLAVKPPQPHFQTRESVRDGVSTVADADRRPLCSSTLSEPVDASFVDDARVFHGVSPITALDPSRPAFRDVLVVTFRAEVPSAEAA